MARVSCDFPLVRSVGKIGTEAIKIVAYEISYTANWAPRALNSAFIYVLKGGNIDEKSCWEKFAKQTDVSVQPMGKWIEHISQSELALS